MELIPTEPSISSVTATGAKLLEVSFNKSVDDTLATITVKKGTSNVNVASITWNAEKTLATITTTVKMTEGTYNVNVTGLSDAALNSDW